MVNRGAAFIDNPRGVLEMILAGVLWGLLPLYWKLLVGVEPLVVVAHRVLWSLLLLACWLKWSGGFERPTETQWPALLLSATLIGFNWFLYIYAVQSGQVLECSLGYFILPLISVLLGMLVLQEQLSLRRRIAVGFVVAAVCYLIWAFGRIPLIALGLALSFSCYSLVRRRVGIGALSGTLVETALLSPAALFLLWPYRAGLSIAPVVDQQPLSVLLLLVLTGAVTTAPLLLSISASKKLRFTTLGLLQYLAPSIQFLLAVFVFHESLQINNLAAFSMVWLGLAIYTSEIFWPSRTSPQ